MLRTKRGRSRRLPTPPAPGEVVSLHPDNNPTPQNPREFSRWRGGATKRQCRGKWKYIFLDTKIFDEKFLVDPDGYREPGDKRGLGSRGAGINL